MPATDDVLTIQCPACKRSLPPRAATCQFCGADLAGIERPKPAAKRQIGPEKWVMTLYYVVASYWIVDGLFTLIWNLVQLNRPSDSRFPGSEFSSYFGMAIGVFSAMLGLGLILRWDWARGVVNIFSWIRIGAAVLSVFSLVAVSAVFGPLMMLFTLFLTVLSVTAAGLQIWLITETDYMF